LSDRSKGVIGFGLSDRQVEAGETFELVFPVPEEQVQALQFTFRFDPSVLKILSLEPMVDGVREDHFSRLGERQGVITGAIFSPHGLPTGPLFKMTFKSIKAARLSRVCFLDDQPTRSLIIKEGNEIFNPALWENTPQPEISVWPNPFGSDGVQVRFSGAVSGMLWDTRLFEMYDSKGNIIYSTLLKNDTVVRIPASHFATSGVYYWRIAGAAQNGKLVFMP